jgi:hypothetical protein
VSALSPDDEDGIDVTVAVDLLVLQSGLTPDEARRLLRLHAEGSGRDLHEVVSDVIDWGTWRHRP